MCQNRQLALRVLNKIYPAKKNNSTLYSTQQPNKMATKNKENFHENTLSAPQWVSLKTHVYENVQMENC